MVTLIVVECQATQVVVGQPVVLKGGYLILTGGLYDSLPLVEVGHLVQTDAGIEAHTEVLLYTGFFCITAGLGSSLP